MGTIIKNYIIIILKKKKYKRAEKLQLVGSQQ
jgi:hypothetical protein